MAQEEGNSCPSQLGRVNTVSADFRHAFHDSYHIGPCLKKLISHNHSYISGAYHQHPLSGQYPVYIYHSLGGSRSHHAGKRPARETQRILRSSGTDNNIFCLYGYRLPFPENSDPFSFEDTDYRTVQPDFHTALLRLLQQAFSDINPADTGIVCFRPEKLMYLFKQLAAGPFVFINNQNLGPAFGGFNGGCQPRRASSDDDYFLFHD